MDEQQGISQTPPMTKKAFIHLSFVTLVTAMWHPPIFKCSGLGVLGVRRALSLGSLQTRVQVAIKAYNQRSGEEVILLQYPCSNLYLQVVFTSVLLSLGAGVFLGTALLHVLPEVGLKAIPLSLLGFQISEPVFEINILGSS